jgi:hypothetical protein
MRQAIYICLVVIGFGCSPKKYIPIMPYSIYSKYNTDPFINSPDVIRSKNGSYLLTLSEVDTTFSRKKIKYYTSTPKDNAKVIEKIFIYFIDDYRFIYTKKQLDTLEITDLNKNYLIGLYKIYELKSSDPTTYFVEMHITKALTKQPEKYESAILLLKLSKDNERLSFHKAYSSYTREFSAQSTQSFTKQLLEQEENEIANFPMRSFESQEMGQYLHWQSSKHKLITTIQGVPFDNVIYSEGTHTITRTYKIQDRTVFKDTINPSNYTLQSW